MLFKYEVLDQQGRKQNGVIDAPTDDLAITSLQRRGFIVSNVVPADQAQPLWQRNIGFFERVTNKEIVILSRQLSTLFEAQVSALQVFRLLSDQTENHKLKVILDNVTSDLQGGSSISNALSKSPEVFSTFFVNMVKAGEESGRLDETFKYLADYLERSYEVTSKAKNALIYPSFVIFTFVVVMVLMLTLVIPKISGILVDAGQEIPFYTRVVLGMSNFMVDFGPFLAIAAAFGVYLLFQFYKTDAGRASIDGFKISIPYLGDLYQKLYLSRISDNLTTMLASGIPVVKALELTQDVVDNAIYRDAILQATEKVKGGSSVSEALSRSPEIPRIFIQMMRVGEETGNLGEILSTLSRFYQREVGTAVDTLVDMIEPIMIILLGLGVGFLLASVLIPIYNVSSTF